MRSRLSLRILAASLLLLLNSCNYGWYIFLFDVEDVESRADSLPRLEEACPSVLPDFASFPRTYSFVAVADPHVGAQLYDFRTDDFLREFGALLGDADERLRPRFVVCLGDNGDGGRQHEYREINGVFARMAEMAAERGVPNFRNLSIVGNHDLYNDGWRYFREEEEPCASLFRAGKPSSAYRFSDGAFSWYALDSAAGTLGETQRRLLADAMEADPAPKIVLTHVPVYGGGNFIMTMQDTRERNELLTLFERNGVRQVLGAHAHREYGYNYGSWREDVLDAAGQNGRFYLVTVDRDAASVSFQRLEF